MLRKFVARAVAHVAALNNAIRGVATMEMQMRALPDAEQAGPRINRGKGKGRRPHSRTKFKARTRATRKGRTWKHRQYGGML